MVRSITLNLNGWANLQTSPYHRLLWCNSDKFIKADGCILEITSSYFLELGGTIWGI